MKLIKKLLLACALFGATCALSHAAVLYAYAGPQLVNDSSFSLPSLGLSRDDSVNSTLYFKYTVTNPASNNTTENYFAAMQLFESGGERLGVGNGWVPYAYSAYNTTVGNFDLKSSSPESFATYQDVRPTDITTIMIRMDFVSGGNDNITVWLNPNLALTEAAQSPSLTTNFFANASFDEIRLREGGGGNGWTFSDIVIAGNSTDTGFFAVPEPSAALLGAFGLIGLLRRRK